MTTTTVKNFPLLNEIDEQINSDEIDWNQNAFQTLLTSNLPMTTVFYYAVDVGLRRLEASLYEAYWDVTADALNDLSQFLFNTPSVDGIDAYLYEAKCQLLMYASIAIIKLNTIRRRSTNEAKMSSATMCLLLLEQSKSYEIPSIKEQYSSCIHSMRFRYLKRIFIIGQWLPTLSKIQFSDIQLNYERYIGTMVDHLFPAVSLRDKINRFIDNYLIDNNGDENEFSDNEATASGFVFIRRCPKFNEKTIEKHSELMHLGLVNTLNQLNKNNLRKLICCIWTLCCMIESDRVSLEALNDYVTREHFSYSPIDFEQKPITIESTNERDVIVFLLLCAQQNIRSHEGDSTLHPYLLYSSSHLCTLNQKNWWQTAIEKTSWPEFVNHLATIRLDDERLNQYPPDIILLETSKILFKTAQIAYKQHSKRAVSYEQYAIQYYQVVKANKNNQEAKDLNKHDKLFFFYPQKTIIGNNDEKKKLLDECEKLARQCDELKLLPEPEPPRTPSPTEEQKDDFHISAILSSVHVEDEEHSLSVDSTLFVTPTSNKSRDIEIQTIEQVPLPLPVEEIIEQVPVPLPVEEIIETPVPSLPPFVDMIFSHMNGVNQWINRFCISNEGIQNDINTIRDRLDRLNRATSQMIYSNVRILQSNPDETNSHFHSSHQ